jgi:hypothetical protein
MSSAILAPLAMALVGRIWFQYARIVATSESNVHQKGTRLDSLLELSVTSSGTYDPWKLWALFRAVRLRLSLVAVLALLAAISTSLFVNIIAYEAFQATRPFANDRKAMLTSLPRLEIGLNMTAKWGVGVRNWIEADSKVVVEAISVLHQISYGNLRTGSGQSWNPDTGEYIAVNALTSTLDGAHSDIVELMDAPATRLGIRCVPANVSSLDVLELKEGADLSRFEAQVSTSGLRNSNFTSSTTVADAQ